MIAPDHYRSADIFQRELKQLFLPSWQFAAMTDELQNNRDFVCVDFPGAAVVVQNVHGELRAFQNICTHRFNRLQTESRGNRHLACRYHGWTFSADGCPAPAIVRQFAVDGVAAADLCLPRYRVEVIGKFVFVALADPDLPLKAFLGGYAEALERLSAGLGQQSYFGEMAHAANWKLIVENVLECYHCNAVHPDTFVAGLGVGRSGARDLVFDAGHSSCHFPKEAREETRVRRRAFAHLDARPMSHASYYHMFIFPNLFVASIEGVSFYVGHLLPRAADRSLLRIRFYEPAVELAPNKRVLQDAITQSNTRFGIEVIEEDRAILEQVQHGITVTKRRGAIGPEEIRIRDFAERYEMAMGAHGLAHGRYGLTQRYV